MSDVFWAAFGGGAAAGIFTLIALMITEWFKWFLDRPLVKVSFSTGYIISQKDRSDLQFFMRAANPHTRPVTLSSFGLLYSKVKWGKIQVTPQLGYVLPFQIDAGKSIQQWSDVKGLFKTLKESNRKPTDLKWVYFQSETGKYFRGKINSGFIAALQSGFDKYVSEKPDVETS